MSKNNGLVAWIDKRYPLTSFWNDHLAKYYAPKNFNFWYFFGVFSMVVLINQIITGIWLTMYYTPTGGGAFSSVEYIMRHVRYGWLLRYLHTTGASAFFIVLYLHMYRGIMYGSHKAPRELLWIIGCILYCIIIVESVSGYVLPWGQMSFWAIKVLISVFSVIPWVGKSLVVWIQGDYNVSAVTLHRFFSFHVIAIPLIILLLVFIHMVALHKVGSNNPDGIEIKENCDSRGKPLDGIPFHPYYSVKDFMGLVAFLFFFLAIVFFAPTMGGYFLEHANFIPANSMVTPLHIAPPWYLAPFYSILRSVPNKMLGICLATGAMVIIFFLPWLDRSPVKSVRYRGAYTKWALTLFVIGFIWLGYLGTSALTTANIYICRVLIVVYYAFFLLMPFYTKFERTKPVPERVR